MTNRPRALTVAIAAACALTCAPVAVPMTPVVTASGFALPTLGDCSKIDFFDVDLDGSPLVPIDLDHDGFVSCDSDLELGA